MGVLTCGALVVLRALLHLVPVKPCDAFSEDFRTSGCQWDGNGSVSSPAPTTT